MHDLNRIRNRGFTLVEVAVSIAILAILSLVVGWLVLGTVDSYGQMATDTFATKQARHSLDMIAHEMRESVNFSIDSPADAGLLNATQDALLLTSARDSSGAFIVDGNNFASPQSITLFYLNTTAEGINQLVRHQLYYVEDLNPYTPPFVLASPSYVGANLVIIDNAGAGAQISIDRATGSVAGVASLRQPTTLMNETMSLDIVDNLIDPIEARVVCQDVDRNGRTATSRLRTQIDPRNI